MGIKSADASLFQTAVLFCCQEPGGEKGMD